MLRSVVALEASDVAANENRIDADLRQLVADELGRALATLAPVPREVMNADEVAVFLGVDRKTVYDYANRGHLPHQRLGKRLLFSRSALVAWLGACTSASAEQGG